MSPSEKRRSLRIQPYVAPCRLVEGVRRVPGYLTDLSVEGAQVSCDATPPAPGTGVTLEVRFGQQVRYTRLTAEVKWVQAAPSEHGPHVIGLIFAGSTQKERGIVASVVDEFRRRASQLA